MPQPPLRPDPPGRLRSVFALLTSLSPAAILVVLTALVVGIGLLLVQSTYAQRTARQTADAEVEAAMALKAAEQTLLDAETGQRGFLLTQDPAYLQPYDAAQARIGKDLELLQTKFGSTGDPQTDDRLRAIDQLAKAKMTELDQTVRYARNGNLEAAMIVVRGNAGKASMDQLRQHLAALGVGLRQRRADAFAAAERAESWQVPLLLGMWLALLLMVWAAQRSERRRVRAEIAASHTERLHELNERNLLLAQELNHRVKNLFSVVLSLIGMAAREKGDTASVVAGLSERVHGLARAHALAFGATPDATTDLSALLGSVIEPYQDQAGGRITLSGGPCGIGARQVTPLALVLHELATNASKYGALSVAEGRVEISWSCAEADQPKVLTTLVWREIGGPPPPESREPADPSGGFGTKMTAAVLRQIGGTIARDWPGEGALVTITFVREAEPED
jgi:two-component sensor histidine kinase